MKIKKWITPISEVKNLTMVELIDKKGKLIITLLGEGKKFQLIFQNPPVYRNILEEYHTNLWEYLDNTKQRRGNTFKIIDCEWVEYLKKHEPLLSFYNEKLEHYIIVTNDDVIEILSNKEPIMKIL